MYIQTAYRLLLAVSLLALSTEASRPSPLDELLFQLQLERELGLAFEGRERRNELPQGLAGSGASQMIPRPEVRRLGGGGGGNVGSSFGPTVIALDQLNAIESLNSLLEDGAGNLPRLGRAYKPKTMSTARGFGKRSSP